METSACSSFSAKSKGILFGLLLVIAGLLFLSFNFGWIDPALKPILFSWPIIFIVTGIIGFSNYLTGHLLHCQNRCREKLKVRKAFISLSVYGLL